ncbi:Baculoviral IAP repeat-containing protein 5 [Lamellibrachia satsuma]|nr:Baculoviral IAP repeat-containing protein 5 [Lamellibrachia satsuma]
MSIAIYKPSKRSERQRLMSAISTEAWNMGTNKGRWPKNNPLLALAYWPFEKDCSCTPAKMAEAGFYHIGSDQEPDLVRCFVCLKELDGWEPNDLPWEEHRAHSAGCLFLKLKNPKEMTIAELLKLEAAAQVNLMKKSNERLIAKYEKYAEETRNELEKLAK